MIPPYLLRHTITVERFAGHGSTGPKYGGAEQLAAFIDANTRNVRSSSGETRVSSTTVLVQLDTAVGLRDRLTLDDGRVLRVIDVKARESRLPEVPDHIEIICE